MEIGDIHGMKSKWRVLRSLGRGGQGEVYEVDDVTDLPVGESQVANFAELLAEFDRTHHNRVERDKTTEKIVRSVRGIVKETNLPRGAMKELLPIDDAVNSQAARARMRAEIEIARSVQHPALVRILDVDESGMCFVMEFFSGGTLANNLNLFQGNVLGALRAVRPIVDALAVLHRAGVVHRDIKPDNVFLRTDQNLVLGDFGLAIKLDNRERLTDTFENVGTRDYQPPWTYSSRLEDVKPNFDVFGLAKLLWAMISGRPQFPLEDFNVDPHDLRSMFPDNSDVLYVHRIFEKAIVRREPQCQLADGRELLADVDGAIRALESGGQLPRKGSNLRCCFCGIGTYSSISDFDSGGFSDPSDRRYFYRCDSCGHIESFLWRKDQPPPAWPSD